MVFATTSLPEEEATSMSSLDVQGAHEAMWSALMELDDNEIEEGLREPYGSWDPPKPWPDDEDARLTEQESQGKGSGRGEEDCEERGDNTDEGEETSEEEEEDSEGETTIYINVRRFTCSPTPENDVGCSPRTKHLRSRRRKEMRELKAMSLARRPPRPEPTLEEQQACPTLRFSPCRRLVRTRAPEVTVAGGQQSRLLLDLWHVPRQYVG
ncbi:hypothetical protein FA13DRAFT_1329736 [Coprinellus micaceus]|uniref:Uncharacterized protein n=1 Tax=Coprinellus micaceus TaxID=71717 RepID=A0A4Y7SQU5_COPMI|nr:hypothetical protein FA13DRAFT_1329736 [Coprinellus micaceus]